MNDLNMAAIFEIDLELLTIYLALSNLASWPTVHVRRNRRKLPLKPQRRRGDTRTELVLSARNGRSTKAAK